MLILSPLLVIIYDRSKYSVGADVPFLLTVNSINASKLNS